MRNPLLRESDRASMCGALGARSIPLFVLEAFGVPAGA
jgi:hypothetical protein